jgi:hypothetical protein
MPAEQGATLALVARREDRARGILEFKTSKIEKFLDGVVASAPART